MNSAPASGVRRQDFADLMRRHRGYMFRLAYSRVSNEDAAEDMVQQLLEGMWRTYVDLSGGDKAFLIYVAVALRHATIGRTKAGQRWRFTAVDDQRLSTTSTAFDAYAHAEEGATLSRAVDELPAPQREAVRLLLEGASYEQAASALGSTVDGVHARLRTARQNLAELLRAADKGGPAPELRGVEKSTPNVAAMARDAGVNYATMYARLRKGLSKEDAAAGRSKTRARYEDEREAFRSALAAAPHAWTPRERAAVEAYYFDGRTVGEAAERLGATSSAVASTLMHARKTLRAWQRGEALEVKKRAAEAGGVGAQRAAHGRERGRVAAQRRACAMPLRAVLVSALFPCSRAQLQAVRRCTAWTSSSRCSLSASRTTRSQTSKVGKNKCLQHTALVRAGGAGI